MDRQLALDGVGPMNSDSAPATPHSFSRPRPRPQRSPSEAAKVRVRNRRRQYLDRNPKYFSSVEQEFADPDLYDKLIRQFLTPAEREAEGRSKGWGKTLESSLMRGEARLEQVTSTSPSGSAHEIGFSVVELVDDKPTTKEEGRAAWDEFLRERFVRGGDEDFDYAKVDENDDLDSLEYMDREEAYFDEEEPEWADDSESDDGGAGSAAAAGDGREKEERQRPKRERVLLGQTGVQDY